MRASGLTLAAAFTIDLVIGRFWTLGGVLMAVSSGAETGPTADFDFHSSLVWLPVGLAMIAGAGLLGTRRAVFYRLGVWINSGAIVATLFMFARGFIDRWATMAHAHGSPSAAVEPLISVTAIVARIVQVVLLSIALQACLRLARHTLETEPAAAPRRDDGAPRAGRGGTMSP